MNWDHFVPIAVAFIGLIGVSLQRQTGLNRQRRRIKADLDILGVLPQDISVRGRFEDHICQSIEHLVEVHGRRDWGPFVTVCVSLLIMAMGLIVPGFIFGGWWWVSTAFGALLLISAPAIIHDEYQEVQRSQHADT
jgi:hypothetical protein